MKNIILSRLWHSIKNSRIKARNHNLVLNYNVKISEVSFGSNVYIGENSSVFNAEISDCSYVGDNSFINKTIIGKFCSIGPGVKMGMGTHPVEIFVSSSPYFYAPKDFKNFSLADKTYFAEHKITSIGSDVWIGANVIIVDGVNIGHGAVIAAGAVVTADVLPYSIVGGVPAKKIKNRFSDEDIEFLLKSEWWNRDMGWLKENFKTFHDIENFKKNNFGNNK